MHRKQQRKAVGAVRAELVEMKASLRALVADKGLGVAAPAKAGAAAFPKSTSASPTELAVLAERLSLVATHQRQAKKDQEDQFQALDAKLEKLMKALVC
jgi:ribosomal protein S15P/S13E